MADADRIEALEASLRSLSAEVRALRAEVERLSLAASDGARLTPPAGESGRAPDPMATPRSPMRPSYRSSARAAFDRLDRPAGEIEALVGRYGTIALATLTLLMGAGAFLTWAIANDKIGPVARVFLGALAAGAVAALGWRLRRQGTVRFGNTLLALALALVHVDAWGAGPYLRIVSPGSALVVAAACSVVLALLALRTEEELLFTVGVGGALVAPFVTSVSETRPLVLLSYGLVVIAAGGFAVRDRRWRFATRLLGLGCAVYATAGFQEARLDDRVERNAPAAFALLCAWSAVAWPGRNNRVTPALSSLAVAATALLWVAATVRPAALGEHLTFALAGTLSAYGVLQLADDRTDPTSWLAGALLLPLEFLAVTIVALPDAFSPAGARLAALWTALAVAASWPATASRRATHLLVATLASGLAIALGLSDTRFAFVAALSAYGVAWSVVLRRARTMYLLAPIAFALLWASARTYAMLAERPIYEYVPFATVPSLAALLVVTAWLVFAWHAAHTAYEDFPSLGVRGRVLLGTPGVVAAFLWAREELRGAFGPDIATFLQIGYFATTGIVAIYLGRERNLPLLRGVGLALAIFAALMAVWLAKDLGTVGLRVGSFILVGCFLFVVAYWYRVRGEDMTTND